MVDGLTYSEVGASLDERMPAGYHHLDVRRRVSTDDVLDRLGDFVLGWGLQRAAGLRVPDLPPAEGLAVTLRLGLLPVPVTVVQVLDAPDYRGFVYGTRRGHPESGEEAFLAEHDDLGTWIHVRAFSRPGTWWSRLGTPVTAAMRRRFTEKYVRAAQDLVSDRR